MSSLVLLFSLLLPGSATGLPLPNAAQETTPALPEPATVRVWNRDIVVFRSMLGSITPAESAESATERIEKLPETALFEKVTSEHATLGNLDGLVFRVGSPVLFGLLRDDLDPLAQLTLDQAGEQIKAHLQEVLQARAEQRSLPLVLKGIGITLAELAALVALIAILTRARRRLLEKLEWRTDRARRLQFAGLDLRSQAKGWMHRLVILTSRAICLLALYIWLSTSLALFPYTAPWGQALGGWVIDTSLSLLDGVIGALPGLATAVVIFLLTRWSARFAGRFFLGVERGAVSVAWLLPETARATRRIANIVIWLFGLVFAYPYLPGSGSEAFKGMSVLLGLMVSLGSAGFVNQIMSGFVVLFSRAVRPGEQVRIGEVEGVVRDVGFLATRVLTAAQEEITIPNAVVVSDKTVNYSRLAQVKGTIATVSVTIGYDAPWRQVHGMLLLAARRTPRVLAQPEPRVLQRALGDFYVEYQLIVVVEPGASRPEVLSVLHSEVLDAFNEHGVQIMSPHFEGQPDRQVLVPRERWFAEPASEEPAHIRSGEGKSDPAGPADVGA